MILPKNYSLLKEYLILVKFTANFLDRLKTFGFYFDLSGEELLRVGFDVGIL